MATLQLKTLTGFETEHTGSLIVRSYPNLPETGNVMKTLFAALFATIFAGFVPSNALAQGRLHEEYRGTQRCMVVNCNSPTPAAPSSNAGSADVRSDSVPAPRASKPESVEARYDRINANARRTWNEARSYSSYNRKIDGYQAALGLFREQQKIQDGPNVRDAISHIEALILWYNGVISDQNKEYLRAIGELNDAYRKRPDVFSEGNHNYKSAVFDRYLASLPRGYVYDTSKVVPDSVLEEAIANRVFYNSPPGVSDRVRKGFQAVMSTYPDHWKVAKAWFQDALNHDPGNPNIMSFLAIIDEPNAPHLKTEYLKQGPDPGKNLFGQKLPNRFTIESLKAHSNSITNKQIMKALEDIIFLQFVESSK